jgi:hypothetical protein
VRFHFQVRTESHVVLTEVTDLRDDDEARIEAAKRVGTLLGEHAGKLWADENWQMDVTDERGLILFVISVQAMKSPATSRFNVRDNQNSN